MKVFVALILAVGAARFALDRLGFPKDTVKYVSMTAVIAAGTIYFAIVSRSRKERLKSAFLLVLPYMVVEVLALGYTWLTGVQTIFHLKEYSFGTSIAAHTIGHIVGGLTWEPLFVFLLMEIVWYVYAHFRGLTSQQPSSS